LGAAIDIADTLWLDNEPFEVGRAASWLNNLLENGGMSPRVIAALQVALDEVLNNILVHGYADLEAHKIEVRLNADAAAATLEFVDDGIPFDPTQHEIVPRRDNETVRPGGLGLAFIRRLMDDVTYERIDDHNHLKLCKFVSQ